MKLKSILLTLFLFCSISFYASAQEFLTDPDYIMAMRALEKANDNLKNRDYLGTLTYLGRAKKKMKKLKKKYPNENFKEYREKRKAIKEAKAKAKEEEDNEEQEKKNENETEEQNSN